MAAFLGGLLLSLVILSSLVIWSIRRHRDPDLHIECDSAIHELMPTLAGLTMGTAVAGNTAAVLENGAFFDVLISRIQAARASVHLETFLWKEGALGRRVAEALIDRARAGVKVRVLLDAEGSKAAGDAVVQQMRDAGCRVVFFHERKAAKHRRTQRPRPPQIGGHRRA
jgi:cardiolipin synthase